jgi:phosphatidylserine decarboxylase
MESLKGAANSAVETGNALLPQPTKEQRVHRDGWQSSHRVHKEFLDRTIDEADRNPKALQPPVQELKDLIEGDTRLFLLFTSMFDEIPSKQPYNRDPASHKQVRDYPQYGSMALPNSV